MKMDMINRPCQFFCAAALLLLWPIMTSPALPDIPIPASELALSTGVLSGTAREYVYENGYRISELDWPVDSVSAFSAHATLVWGGKLELSSEATFALTRGNGSMTDSDYLNMPTDTAKTHYSRHDATLDAARILSADLGWHFELPVQGPYSKENVRFTPSIGLRFLHYEWTASNGYIQYGSQNSDGTYTAWNENLPKVRLYGNVITYKQEYLFPNLRMALRIPVGDRFSAEFGIRSCPFVWATGTDHHILRSLWFYDIMQAGQYVEPDASVNFRITRHTSCIAHVRWTSIDGLRGSTYQKTDSSSSYTTYSESDGNGGGAAFSELAVELGLSFTTD